MTHASRLFGDRTRTALKAAADDALVVFPLGATEQHGPHLPVATDSLLVEMIAERAASNLEGSIPVLVAPTLAFGSSAHHLPFGATLSLPTTTYLTVLMELGRSAFTSGFRRVFFLNGHGGNAELAELAARDLAIEYPMAAGAGSWWRMARDLLVDAGEGAIENVPGHAGGFETAAVLAARPELVVDPPVSEKQVRPGAGGARNGVRSEFHGWWRDIDGFTDNPSAATASMGEAFIDVAVQKVADDLLAFYRAAAAAEEGSPARRPDS